MSRVLEFQRCLIAWGLERPSSIFFLVINTEELIQRYFPVPGIDIEDCKHNIDLNGLLTIKAKNSEECYRYAVHLLWDDADFGRAIVTKRIIKGYLVVDVSGFKKSS
ncbi:hypothetical protein CTI12_AA292300 [Artemisia annua]|uniref:Uncharacterized protein n=1 Tax=Artemisia annua TaxID=35608 RepID=A0A2U1N946_ARTAN|nr:hypothetical protein CTI12_AA292300 [Artemisia annua]